MGVLFALEMLKCVVVLMPSRSECLNRGTIAKMSGMCLIVHGAMTQREMNYQLASAKKTVW